MFNLNPWLAAGVFIAGIAAGTTASVTSYEKLIMPGRVDTAVAAARADEAEKQALKWKAISADAAAEAERAARDQERAAADFAYAAVEAAARMRETMTQSKIEKLEAENDAYAKQLVAEGRACPLSDADIEWLQRNDPKPEPD